jgi:RNA 2',3'-cyclic 3'-phosphodiesterase
VAVRLFAALVPPEPVLDHLEGALDGLRSGPGAPLRWVPRENLHLTLAFYGAVPDGAVPDVSAALAQIAAVSAPAEVMLSGAGAFGGRTLWIGVGGEVATVQRLMRAAAELVDERSDDGPARPHVTVARSGRRARGLDLGPAVRALSVYRGPSWRAGELALMSSHLGEGRAGAPRYQVTDVLPLG